MPIEESSIQCDMDLKQPGLKEYTIAAVAQALKKKDLAQFTTATLTSVLSMLHCLSSLTRVRNTLHTSDSDPREHITVRLTTPAQAAKNKGQAIHVYCDENKVYEGHRLYPVRNVKPKE